MKEHKEQDILDLDWENLKWIFEIRNWFTNLNSWQSQIELDFKKNPNTLEDEIILIKKINAFKRSVQKVQRKLNQQDVKITYAQILGWDSIDIEYLISHQTAKRQMKILRGLYDELKVTTNILKYCWN